MLLKVIPHLPVVVNSIIQKGLSTIFLKKCSNEQNHNKLSITGNKKIYFCHLVFQLYFNQLKGELIFDEMIDNLVFEIAVYLSSPNYALTRRQQGQKF